MPWCDSVSWRQKYEDVSTFPKNTIILALLRHLPLRMADAQGDSERQESVLQGFIVEQYYFIFREDILLRQSKYIFSEKKEWNQMTLPPGLPYYPIGTLTCSPVP